MDSKTIVASLSFLLLSCQTNSSTPAITRSIANPIAENSNPYPQINAIPLPPGFVRVNQDDRSFGQFLRKTSLKKDKTVYLYNGIRKTNQTAQFAVLDISTGNKNLQQCADAVMRLRTEYLFATQQYSKITFTDNNGTIYQFRPPYTRINLDRYLQTVFGMCGSASLAKQLNRIKMQQMAVGDVLIRGGFPGHAVIVMDMAQNATGETIFLLAQSYMPAQDIHVLVNNHSQLTPWYQLNDDEKIDTPEYTFDRKELSSW